MFSITTKRVFRWINSISSMAISKTAVFYPSCVYGLSEQISKPNLIFQVRYYHRKLMSPPISESSPELLLYWHPTKNGQLTPDQITIKSFKKIWWKCPKGVDHEWECSARYIVNENGKYVGCPFCKNKKVSISNSLSTKCPELAAQWHPTKNGSVLPSSITYLSSKEMWWKCDKDASHEWKTSVKSRVHPMNSTEGSCPFCSGLHISVRNLQQNFPEIAKEWNYEKNGCLLPSQVSKSSAARVWWKCSKGHEWQASVNNRTSTHHCGCPICTGHNISLERSLAYQYPEIASQWHPTLNAPLTPSVLFPTSHLSVWWVCTSKIAPHMDRGDDGFISFENETSGCDDMTNECGRCGNIWQERIVNRVSRFKYGHSLLCPNCARETKRAKSSAPSKPSTPHISKKLRNIRVVGGKNHDDVIIVSSADYDTLIGTGAYGKIEIKEETKKQNTKEIYGKKKSIYKKVNSKLIVNGHRIRTILSNIPSKPKHHPVEAVIPKSEIDVFLDIPDYAFKERDEEFVDGVILDSDVNVDIKEKEIEKNTVISVESTKLNTVRDPSDNEWSI